MDIERNWKEEAEKYVKKLSTPEKQKKIRRALKKYIEWSNEEKLKFLLRCIKDRLGRW